MVCIHGNSLSKDNFIPLWKDPQFESYPFVIYDLPGHGDSDRPDNPEKAYALSGYAEQLIELVNSLELKSFIFIGFSLGGHIAIEAAAGRHIPGLKGIFIIGTPPVDDPDDFPRAFMAYSDGLSLFKEAISRDEAMIIASRLSSDQNLRKKNTASILSTDPAARRFLTKDIMTSNFHCEQKFIEKTDLPVTLVFGENDQIINPEYIDSISSRNNSNIQVKIIPGEEHLPNWKASREPGSLLAEFLEQY